MIQSMEDKWTAHAGFIGGALAAIVPSFKLWLAQAPINESGFIVIGKVILFLGTTFFAGIVGMASKDVYTIRIKPWLLTTWIFKVKNKV